MSDNILAVAETSIHPGQLDNLRALVREMIDDIQRDEPGTLNYEWFIADDGKSMHVYERYADSEAYVLHLRNFGQRYAERCFACLTTTQIAIYGNPSDELRALFAEHTLALTYLSPFAGFAANSQILNSHILKG